ncbi:flippase [Hufsiella ginkgonis]|uniref:Oligosaccharide flippase family protein n=1 Tax=Hufsiella ginkgonis TaxID=2695274 RepID=A0A7K1XYV3_9SPHI|nr:flippase [Hufsiella ginkgonis]MXV16171.1 oligosaccharide flippase family protein [Hufsiella ginkgonis]
MKLKEQYWLSSGIINILQNVTSVFFSVGAFFILVRVLSTFDYGAWGIFMGAVTILELTRNGLIESALIKFIASSEKEKHSEIISASLAISITLTVICVLLNLCFAGFAARLLKTPELQYMFYVYNITFIISGLLTQFCCIERANLKYTANFASSFIRQGVFFVVLAVVFIFKIKIDLYWLVYLHMACVILSVIVAWYYVRPFLHYSFRFNLKWIKSIFHYGKYAFGTSLSALLAGTVDQWMLAAILSTKESGAFRVAVSVMNLIDIPTNAIAVIVFPQSAKRLASGGTEAIKYLYEKSVGTIVAILVPAVVFLFVFDKFVIQVLAGDKYAATVPILNVALIYSLFIPYGRQFGVIMDSIGKTSISFYNVVGFTLVNLTLNYFFIKQFGVIGAPCATLLAIFIGFIVAQIILRKVLRVNVFNTLIYAYHFYPEMYHKFVKRDKTQPPAELENL